MQEGKQSDNYNEAHEYLESNGPMLCLLAMFLWLMTVQKEAKQIYVLGSAVLNLTGGGKATYFHVEESSISFEIKSMSRARAVLIFCLVIIPRAVRYIMLGIIGIRYLSVTMGLEDLLLNAMALEVVISVDELVFRTFCSLEVNTLIRRTEPLSKPRSKLKACSNFRTYPKSFLIAGAFAVAYMFALQPIVAEMQLFTYAMCSGNRDYIHYQDLAGIIAVWGNPSAEEAEEAIANLDSYGFQARLQNTKLDQAVVAANDYSQLQERENNKPTY